MSSACWPRRRRYRTSLRHARALDAQIRVLRLQRAVLRAVARSTEPEELERMTDLTKLTAGERRRILEDYLDAVFGCEPSPTVDRLRMGAPELDDDPTVEQVAAWVELVELLRDPDYIEASRRMVEPARIEAAEPDGVQLSVQAVGTGPRSPSGSRLSPTAVSCATGRWSASSTGGSARC